MAKAQKSGKQQVSNTSNSHERIEAIRAAILAGDSARAIHEKLGTSIVNVHYHKSQMRKQGLLDNMPKGKPGRKVAATPAETPKAALVKAAKATEKVAAKPAKAKAVKAAAPVAKKAAKTAPATASATTGKGLVSVVVNGTKITTDKPVKSYSVSKNSVLIQF